MMRCAISKVDGYKSVSLPPPSSIRQRFSQETHRREYRLTPADLNTPPLRRALAVPSSIKNYSVISPSIFDAFTRSNDEGFSTIPQVRHLLEHEIDVLFYNGNLDIACNTAGNLRLFDNMPWKGWTEFAGKRMGPWTSSARSKGRGRAQGLGEVVDIARHGQETVGTYKEVKKIMREGSEKETKFAFVTIDLSGHLVPQDQPEVALDMVQRWLGKKSFGYEREEVPEEL